MTLHRNLIEGGNVVVTWGARDIGIPASRPLLRPCPRCGAQPGHACKPLRRRPGYLATLSLAEPHQERRQHREAT